MAIFLKFWALIALTCAMANSSYAQQSAWNHNNSIMEVSIDGVNLQIYYLQPRAGLPAKAGNLLFDGSVSGSKISGIAYLFSEKCGPTPYDVSGFLSATQNTFTLSGKAPRRGPDCRVVSYFDDTLSFNFIHGINVFMLRDPINPQRPQTYQNKNSAGKSNNNADEDDKELQKLRRMLLKHGD